MIHVDTEGPIGDEYADWRKRACDARKDMLNSWQKTGQVPNLKQRVWRELKELFINALFHEKCAYCESRTTANFPLHVEHYRPKAGVTEKRNEDDPKIRDVIDHPGYFWLAYEWYNLILACANCNTDHAVLAPAEEKRSHPGKKNGDLSYSS